MWIKRAAAGLALTVLAGCGDNSGSDVAAVAVSEPPAANNDVVMCHHHEVPVERLMDPRPATELKNGPEKGLFKNKPGDIGDLADYSIVDDELDFVSIIRLHPRGERKPRPEFTHDLNAWKYVASTPGAQPEWTLWTATTCALQRAFEGLEVAATTFDPNALPEPGDRSIQLLVHEGACASGQSAEGRIRVPVLEVTPEAVRVAIATVRREGGQDCQGNPNTPFTLELPEPLGERRLIDVGVYPEREIKEGKGS